MLFHKPIVLKNYQQKMINDLKQSLNMFLENESAMVKKFALKRRVNKNELILEVGHKAVVSFYIQQGISRSFIIKNGEEITTQFNFEGDLVFPLNAYFDKSKSDEFIQAMTELEYFEINLNEFERLKQKNYQLCSIEEKIYQLYNYQLRSRVRSFQTKTAKERYMEIIEYEPFIVKYCQLTHLASYLGISLGSLSRIRKEIRNNII